jgi:hypothetical protein
MGKACFDEQWDMRVDLRIEDWKASDWMDRCILVDGQPIDGGIGRWGGSC